MKKLILLTLLAFICISGLYAQSDFAPRFDDGAKGVVYNKEFSVDLRAHTNGLFAFAVNFGKIKTYYKTKYYHFEIGEIKHNKEFRTRELSRTNISGANSYVFGKQNNFFVLRGGLGTKRYLTEKAVRKGLAVGINYEYGPSIGFIKPYYLNVRSDSDSNTSTRSIRYTEENAAKFLDINKVQGYSGFTKGLGEVSVVPGINGKFGLHFDWGAFDEFVKAIEVGVMADIYLKTIPIMVDDATVSIQGQNPVEITPANVRNRPFFINLYLSLQLGKRR